MTYLLAATHETALKLATLWAAGKLPPMADTLDRAETLRQLHPRPLRYGLAIWVAKIAFGRSRAVSVDLAQASELALAVNLEGIDHPIAYLPPSAPAIEMLDALNRADEQVSRITGIRNLMRLI